MRILQIAPPWFAVPPSGYGGIELVVAALADGLTDLGNDVELVASGGSRTRARLVSPYETPPSEQLGDALVELPHLMAAYERARGVDIVHDHTTIGAAMASLADGPPVVHTLHGDWTPPISRLMRHMSRRVHLVAISHNQASRAPQGVRIAGVVHNGIDVGRYPFTPQADGDGHLAFLGRAGADKGADVAVEVAARTGRPLRMALKVNEEDEQQWWHEVMQPLLAATDASVELIHDADHEEKLHVIAGAHALLCPLRWDEPFGLMMVEAGACGTPVVAWEHGAATELLVHGETGMLVPPDDVDGLCDAVERVGGFDRAAARSRVEQQFSDRRMVQGYQRLYRRILAGERAGRTPADHEGRDEDRHGTRATSS